MIHFLPWILFSTVVCSFFKYVWTVKTFFLIVLPLFRFLLVFRNVHGAQARAPSAGHPPPRAGRPGAGFAAICYGFSDSTKPATEIGGKTSVEKGGPKKRLRASGLQRIGLPGRGGFGPSHPTLPAAPPPPAPATILFFNQNTAYDIFAWLDFRLVLFLSFGENWEIYFHKWR